MKRTATGLGVAAAVACAVTLGAQTSTPSGQRTSSTTEKSHYITVTGCLARDTSGGFTLNNAKMDNGAARTTKTSGTTTAGTTGSTTTAGGATTTSGTNANATMSNAPAMNWMLSGDKSDLDKHV